MWEDDEVMDFPLCITSQNGFSLTPLIFQEHRVYVEVTSALCDERIVWREDGVPIIQSKENPNDYS